MTNPETSQNSAQKFPAAIWKPLHKLSIALLGITMIFIIMSFYLHRGRFMLWNVFLAGLPLIFAFTTLGFSTRRHGKIRTAIAFFSWLLLFPNAPYLITDLIHISRYNLLWPGPGHPILVKEWLGLVHLYLATLIGISYGNISLYIMHCLVRKKAGNFLGWLFVLAVSALSGVAIYIGRFLRFNSWDVIQRPMMLAERLRQHMNMEFMMFFLLFTATTIILYVIFHCTIDRT